MYYSSEEVDSFKKSSRQFIKVISLQFPAFFLFPLDTLIDILRVVRGSNFNVTLLHFEHLVLLQIKKLKHSLIKLELIFK